MNSELTDALAEQWRDALSAYVMHHVLPDTLQAGALNMITAEHLDRYFMMDTQVTSKVTTSYLAEALACTQSYINSILNNLEPGYPEDFDPKVRTFWQQAMSNYSIWAAYQMLEDYPENYIRADLRLDKTTLFKTLENDLSQGRITDAAVQNALLTYLKHYEHQNSIRVQSGYIDYREDNLDSERFDGFNFANSNYYLLGKDTASPPQYYWRQVDVRLDQASTYIQPDAWTEWQPITLPAGSTLLHGRLVLFCGRLHMVWLHYGAPVTVQLADGTEQERYTLKLEIIYLGLDKQWSAPELLWSEDIDGAVFDPTPYRLLVLALGRAQGSDDQLYVALATHDDGKYEKHYIVQRDVLKRAVADVDFPPESGTENDGLMGVLFKHFSDEPGKLNFQRRVSSSDFQVQSVESDGVDPHLDLDVLLQQQGKGKYELYVRARSTEVRKYYLIYAVSLGAGLITLGSSLGQVQVRSTASGKLELRCLTSGAPDFNTLALGHSAISSITLSKGDFKETSYGWHEATKEIEASEKLISALTGYKATEVREGAGFTVSVDGSKVPSVLVDGSNVIIVLPVITTVDDMELKVVDTPTPLWTGPFTYNGAASSSWESLAWPEGKDEVKFTVGQKGQKVTTFTLKRSSISTLDLDTMPHIHQQVDGTDFLVLKFIHGSGSPLAARLNSQQVPDLINRAQVTPQAVFSWDAQHLQEPDYDPEGSGGVYQVWRRSAEDPLLNVYDANGMYLRELFFHVPHLIASRLQEEERFEEARRWLGLIFNPQSKQAPTESRGVDYWNCAWLMQDDTEAAAPEHELIDPHAIALRNPSHYRKAVFVQSVGLLIGEADLQYRRQTRDSLANAWLLYRMAADLMGEAPDARSIDTWAPRTVSELLAMSDGGELLEHHAHAVKPENLPKQLSTFFWAGAAAHPAFRLPANRALLDTWELLAQRFYNLRHFLSIEGYPMELPLYAPAANPFDLLMARMGGNANLAHLLGYRTVVPPYRFRTLVAKAQETVTALIQYGEQLRSFLELEERTELEAMQYQQAAEIAGYTIGIQEQLLSQQQKNEGVLMGQRAATVLRRDHYQRLYEDNLSPGETAAIANSALGRGISTGLSAVYAAAQLASLAPNVFGMANGGQKYEGALNATGMIAEIAAGALVISADVLRETEGYRRRRQEWQLQAKLAGKELDVIDKQLEAQKHTTLAAQASLAHSRKALAHSQQLYAYYQNKSTSVSLYRWLRSQATTWHATLFDVAVSLCNSAQACWQFETGNYDRQIIRTPIWQADRYGLNAGGELRLDLHRLETEALLRHERHLELRKTVSLQALLGQKLVFDAGGEVLENWEKVLEALADNGELKFSLSEMLYDQDYPGHYLRRLHSVALTLPALLGPYQNIRATLTQTLSRLVTQPDREAVLFLTPEVQESDDAGDGRYVMMSLRARQQVCLSSASQDIGLVTAAETDDRYLPFEGTGAVSDWHLKFPRHAAQEELINSLSDIILEVRYLALPGGAGFESDVNELVEKYLKLP
ncbi:neuraminidase-like domain-containing protein [Pseudomonas entomophila]|uniref:Tc toxin subunit A-related protein n=1 Tax=Pseudomonas entomophila TaxID=312306 RepID=UPI0024076FDB|nr:neuraminidase-like domain-containing protein [Pseudomonas entomophila]MDF9618199.1 neuraminidase-like domain-containing protein [Pseudomonas entomophila]